MKKSKQRALWEALEQALNVLDREGKNEKTVEALRKVLVDNV